MDEIKFHRQTRPGPNVIKLLSILNIILNSNMSLRIAELRIFLSLYILKSETVIKVEDILNYTRVENYLEKF
jgi:hypothetical protein